MFNSKPNETPNTAAAADRKRSVIAEDIVIEGNIVSCLMKNLASW